MEDDPGYRTTICGIHRILWTKINIDAAGHIPENILDEINELMETAYTMGKRMDHRLHQYYAKEHGLDVANPMAIDFSEKFHSKVKFPADYGKEKKDKK